MNIAECNPYVRTAHVQPGMMCHTGLRYAYDHRLFYILSGEGVFVTAEGEQPLSPGCLIYVRPGYGYDFLSRMKTAVVNFDMTRACAGSGKPICPVPLARFDAAAIYDATVVEELPPAAVLKSGRWKERFLSLVSAFRRQDACADALTSATVKALLSELVTELRYGAHPASHLADRIEGYIRLHALEPIGNAEIGAALGYHPVYLAAAYKQQTGKTIHAAILQERVQYACVCLVNTDLSLEEIAFEAGFCSLSHFCRSFRRLLGSSPGAYRRQHL